MPDTCAVHDMMYDQHQELKGRVSDLEGEVKVVSDNLIELTAQLGYTCKSVDGLTKTVEALVKQMSESDAKKWRKFVGVIATVLGSVGGTLLVTFLIRQIWGG